MKHPLLARYGYEWSGDYFDSVQHHIHALGVVAANYNALEGSFLGLYLHYFRHLDKAAYLFGQFKNNFRKDTFDAVVDTYENDSDVVQHALWFSHCFDICSENRNTLMHSQIRDVAMSPGTVEKVILRKARKADPRKDLTAEFSLQQIRDAADEIWLLDHYGVDLYFWLENRANPVKTDDPVFRFVPKTLPERPPEPNRLILPPRADGQT